MALIQRGARLRRSPFFDKTREAGCKAYTVYNHTFLPSYYTDPVTEYWHLLKHVALWDVSVERNVEISGPDGFEFMQLLTPRDMSKCAVGQGKYVVITDERGGILNDPVLLRLEENKFWIALADSDILLWAKGLAYHAGMDVKISEPDASPLQVQGPKSKALMGDLFGDKVTSNSISSPTTSSPGRNSMGSHSSSPGPGGPRKSGTRYTSSTPPGARSSGTRS